VTAQASERVIIHVEGLGKEYRLGRRSAPYQTLRESVMGLLRRPWSARRERAAEEVVWALKDVDLDVPPGEVLGIIGRNGAGKSTLLKVLSRITEPTTGRVDLYGRVASLLEVGVGFHPELSGRENVFLNGAILGMSRAEMAKKIDEIVAFAEVERFLDTPVKHYSSGMYLRLAFAVAAHLEPEILIVDEVLAVGDHSFQRKCLGKMGEVARSGRTVLFVSHNLTAVRSLCTRAVVLDGGRVVIQGDVGECIQSYLARVLEGDESAVDISGRRRLPVLDLALKIHRVRLRTVGTRPLVPAGGPIELEMAFEVSETLEEVTVGVVVASVENTTVFECRSAHDYGAIARLTPGSYRIECRIPGNPLAPGRYWLAVGARSSRKYLDYVPQALAFEVYSDEPVASLWMEGAAGLVSVMSSWSEPAPLEGGALPTSRAPEAAVPSQ
jgi:lipopolysaccharide transport system ATP-binding protein